MRKNLLLLLTLLLVGASAAWAESVRINVDKAANVIVTVGNDGAITLPLTDGMNTFDLDASQTPLAVQAAEGATVESVKCNDEDVMPGGYGTPVYRMGIQPMMVEITTSGDAVVEKKYNTYVTTNIAGAAQISCGDQTVTVSENKYMEFPEDATLLVSASEGFTLTNVSYKDFYWEELAVDNGDGTWSVTPDRDLGTMAITAEEKGIHFNVDVNLASNISVIATLVEEGDNDVPAVTKYINLMGAGPYTATAPEGTLYLNFWPKGGSINGITRVAANGVRTELVNSMYVGYRSDVAEGDTFEVNVTGAPAELTFSVVNRGGTNFTLSDYVVSSNKEKVALSDDVNSAKFTIGQEITMAGGNGVTMTGAYGTGIQELSNNNGIVVAKVTGDGEITFYGMTKSGMTVTVDNASAVVVTGGAGNGEAVTLKNGENTLESVQNPLKIEAAQGYRIVSVYDDGMQLKANADGSYNAEVLANGSVIINTAELPKPLPITFTVTGDASQLIVTKDGVPVEFSELMTVAPGTEITVGVKEGWLIKSLDVTGKNIVIYNEESGIYSFYAKSAGNVIVNVEKWVAAEGNALVKFTADTERVSALLFNAQGEQVGSLKLGLNEVKIGTEVRVKLFGDRYLKAVSVNGKDLELAEATKEASFTVEGETTLDVTTYVLCYVSGYKTSDPVNHSFQGYIYINEVGKLTANVPMGAQFTILPVAERGYKFDGFSHIYPEEIREQIGDEIKDSYTVTIPEGVTDISLQGKFVLSGEKKLYTVRGGNTFLNTTDNITNVAMVYINIAEEGQTPMPVLEYNAFEGETVHLMATSSRKDLIIKSYCLYYTQKLIPADYVVNGEDANADNTIYVSAFITEDTGVENVSANSGLTYDAATEVLTAGARVMVFTTSGKLVLTAEAGEVSLSKLPAGMYIVNSGLNTMKIVK